jgi:hypothetical protein
LEAGYDTTATTARLFPSIRLQARIKEQSGSRSGHLIGNTLALLAPITTSPWKRASGGTGGPDVGFVFTDLAVVGAFSGYVLVLECVGLPWPVGTAETMPFDVLPAVMV